MATNSEDVLELALQLGPMARAELVERLLSSFDFPERQRIDALWQTEAESRLDAYERGELKSTPVRDVFARIDKLKNDDR